MDSKENKFSVDCVARQDVESYIEGFINEYTPREELEFINLELDGLKHLPSVTPIRPKGRWIYDKSFANWICSKCGETPKTMGYVGTGAFMAEHFRYCNHCGAEMEGVEE